MRDSLFKLLQENVCLFDEKSKHVFRDCEILEWQYTYFKLNVKPEQMHLDQNEGLILTPIVDFRVNRDDRSSGPRDISNMDVSCFYSGNSNSCFSADSRYWR